MDLKKEKTKNFQLLYRKNLVDFTGRSTESTVKLLKLFEKDGLIEFHEKEIKIKIIKIKIINHHSLLEISRRG